MDNSVWINGEWLSPEHAHVSTQDRGFLLGDSCFETLRFKGGKLEGKQEHIALLRQSRRVLQFEGGPSDTELLDLLDGAEGKLKTSVWSGGVVRVTLSRGNGRGAKLTSHPKLVLQIFEQSFDAPLEPLELITSEIRRNETSPLSRIKAGCYGDNLAALRYANKQGGNEALMRNTRGAVVGLAMGNVIGISENVCVTPPVKDGVRAGFMRGQFLKVAKANGLSVEEKSMDIADFNLPNFVFLGLNSLWGIRPIISLDGSKLPSQMQLPKWVEAVPNI